MSLIFTINTPCHTCRMGTSTRGATFYATTGGDHSGCADNLTTRRRHTRLCECHRCTPAGCGKDVLWIPLVSLLMVLGWKQDFESTETFGTDSGEVAVCELVCLPLLGTFRGGFQLLHADKRDGTSVDELRKRLHQTWVRLDSLKEHHLNRSSA